MPILNTYNLEVLTLCKSLNIHIHAESVSVNMELSKAYGVSYVYTNDNILTWKPYLNQAGDYHQLDYTMLGVSGMEVDVFGVTRRLDKDLMVEYPNLRLDLSSFGDTYLTLREKYPHHRTLIHGIIFPIETSVLLSASDGDILSYDTDLVEPQEYSIISELEHHSRGYLTRWHVPEYTLTDEFYLPALMSGCYASVLMKILNHRVSKIGTSEVHSYYMSEFFKSNLSLHLSVSVLSDDIKMKLYKNLRSLIKNTGQNSTIRYVIDEILSKSGLLVKELMIKDRPPINYDNSDIGKPVYGKDTHGLFYSHSGGVSLAPNGVQSNVGIPNRHTQNTKKISIEYLNSHNLSIVNPADVAIDCWVYSTHVYNSTRKLDYVDPHTRIKYNLSDTEAVLLMIDALSRHLGVQSTNILELSVPNIPLIDTTPLSVLNEDTKLEVELYLSLQYSSLIVPTGDNVREYAASVISFYFNIYNHDYRNNNPVAFSAMLACLFNIETPFIVDISQDGELIEQTIRSMGFVYAEDHDYLSVAIELINVFVGIDILKASSVDSILAKFKDIVDKLTSYTTHVVTNNTYGNIGLMSPSIGVLEVKPMVSLSDPAAMCLEYIPMVNQFEISLSDESNIEVTELGMSRSTVTIIEQKHTLDLIVGGLYENKVTSRSVVII